MTLLHGERDPDLGVRHRRLHTFPGGLKDLRSRLHPDAWARLQLEVEQRHPDVVVDWERLGREAAELTEPVEDRPPTVEERVDQIRRACRKFERALGSGLSGEDRHRVLKGAGPYLAEVARLAVLQYVSLRSLADEEVHTLLGFLIPDELDTEGPVERGRYDAGRGRLDRARQSFDLAREMDPYDPDIDNSEGIGYLENGDLEAAARLFQQARELAFLQLPNRKKSYSWSQPEVRPYIRATCNLGLVRERQGRFEEALGLYEECLQRCPNDGVGARFHLGPLHHRMGNLAQALDCYEEHCRGNLMDPPDAFFEMTNLLIRLGRPEAALERLMEGVDINYHIPRLLLKPPKRRCKAGAAPVESVEWARCYVQEQVEFWARESLDFLAQVWKDRTLQSGLRRLKKLESEVDQATRGERHAALERARAHRQELFCRRSVEQLRTRVLS